MKPINQFVAIAMVPMIMLTSCDESMFSGDQTSAGIGTIMPSVTYDATVKGAPGTRAVTEYSDITVNDLLLTLTHTDKGETTTYAYSEFPTDKGFAVGKYKMSASYGDPEEEGFEKPAVYGEVEFTVNEGKSTHVTLTAVPSKAMVGVEFDQSALDYFTDLKASLHSVGGQTIEYATTESRYAYLKPGEVTLDVTFTKPNGNGATMEVAKFNTVAQHRYKVSVKLGGGENGSGVGEVESITITFDETLTQDDVTVDISDEVLNAPAPEVTLSGVNAGETISMISGDVLAEDVRFDIKSRSGIKSAVLTTTGNKAGIPEGWPTEIDLVSATAEQQQALTNLGFKNIGVFGKAKAAHLAAFDLKDFINNYLPSTAQNSDAVTFSLKVTDINGKTASDEPLSFSVKKDNIELTVETISGEVYSGQESVNVLAHFNGTTLASILKASYLAATGMYKETTISNITQKAEDKESYVVSIKVPSDAKIPVKLRVSASNQTAFDLEIPTGTRPTVTVNENDVFAKSAWVSVGSAVDGNVSVEVSTDGKSYVAAQSALDGEDYKIGGLTPGTQYYVRSKIGALPSDAVTMTTEVAAQIPNSDMEQWTTDKESSGFNSWTKYTPASWGTLNDWTFASKGSTCIRTAAVSIQSSSDCHQGNSAAVIRTVGWGVATTLNTTCNNYAAGALFLGSHGATADSGSYGIDFASRPLAMKFWCKFSKHIDGESGVAEIELLDKDGQRIAYGSLNPDNDSYEQKTINLTYVRHSAKATTLKVMFKSNSKSSLGKSDVSSYNGGNTSTQPTGSLLYVDDIELVY